MIKQAFQDNFPVKTIGIFLIVFVSLIGLMWLSRIVPPLMAGTAPAGLQHYTTLVIQVMDLGFVIPVSLLSAILLMKRKPFGLLLASVMCMLYDRCFFSPVPLIVFTPEQIDNMNALVFLIFCNGKPKSFGAGVSTPWHHSDQKSNCEEV